MEKNVIKTNSLKAWILAARPKTLTGAAVPVMIGVSLIHVEQPWFFNWLPAALCFLFAFVMQIDANFINDFFDYVKGTDDETRLGPKRACAEGWISLDAMKQAIALTTVFACLIGLPLVYWGGLERILVGALCVVFCFLYTTYLSYIGLGDLLVIVFFGLGPVCIFIANKNEDDDYYILTLAAIAKELAFRNISTADVLLAVGLPLNWLSNQRQGFKDYLMRNSEVDLKFCNESYHIRICDVAVYPQGYAGIVASMPSYKGVHMLADIGNGTMNTLVITNGRAMSDRMYTDKLGVHQCVKRIYNAVQAECGKLPDESLIEDFLKKGMVDTSNRILSVMQMEAEKY